MSQHLKLISGNISKPSSTKFRNLKTAKKDINDLKTFLTVSRSLFDETVVIKCPKEIIFSAELMDNFAQNCAYLNQLGVGVIIVHDIIEPEIIIEQFGLSDTLIQEVSGNANNIRLMEAFLTGYVSRLIISSLNTYEIHAVNIAAKDSAMMQGKIKKLSHHNQHDTVINLNYVGYPEIIDITLLTIFETANLMPVITPLGMNEKSGNFLLEPDHTAMLIAVGMSANTLIYPHPNAPLKLKKDVVELCSHKDFKQFLINNPDTLSNGDQMLQAGLQALNEGVAQVCYVNSLQNDAILKAIFTHEDCTKVVNYEKD